MKLGRLDGWDDNTGYNNGGLAPKLAYVCGVNLPIDYTDISSIENFVKYYPQIQETVGMKDWKCLQREIYEEALIITNNDLDVNWGNLSSDEQKIVCQYCTSKVPPNRYGETYPDSETRQEVSQSFDSNNRDVRGGVRYSFMRTYLFNKIGTLNSLETLNTADNDSLIIKWIGGIEGTVEDNGIVGLYDFILSRVGTPYELTGLSVQTYPIIDGSGMTIQEVADAIYEIGKVGIY
jgi:hypothetical protein